LNGPEHSRSHDCRASRISKLTTNSAGATPRFVQLPLQHKPALQLWTRRIRALPFTKPQLVGNVGGTFPNAGNTIANSGANLTTARRQVVTESGRTCGTR